ncbi:MAG: hypothetical protein RSE27_03780 [Ruthenibacterium sp.]
MKAAICDAEKISDLSARCSLISDTPQVLKENVSLQAKLRCQGIQDVKTATRNLAQETKVNFAEQVDRLF